MIWLYSILPFIIIGVGICIVLLIIGLFVFHQTMNKHKKCEKYSIEELFDDGEELSKQLFSYDNHGFKITTTHNRRIISKIFYAKEPNGKLVVLVHGMYANMFYHAPQALEYLKRGYDVFMYNQRGNGGSGGQCNTYGYYEKFDLHSIAKYIRKNLSDKPIIVHGFSMGGATAILQSELNEQDEIVSAYISEGAYSSMKDELMYVAKRGKINNPKKRKLPFKLLLKLGNFFTKLFLHFSYKDVSPKDAIKACLKPVFIIHSMGDMTCPYFMGEELYDCKISGVRDIWTPENSSHIRVYYDYPQKYFEKIENFIHQNIEYIS